MQVELYAVNAEATQTIAEVLAQLLEPGAILLLKGNLGSGKTTFVQGLGRGLNIKAGITSPTFTLIDEYHCGRLPLYHIDLYRLESSQVGSLHLQEYWRGADFPLGVVAIEWAERLPTSLQDYLQIEPIPLSIDTDERKIKFSARGEAHTKLLEKLADAATSRGWQPRSQPG
ncbi:tRNA (adenosine(37)-N6)-threonylcarbamoyltransferase complex ATPase subunit type 1 TsaE [Pseudanabaena sp. PCC 6802]|uniref:tRNA (adenosine(37)-N6)-threonylcarbamoyltransferase complex ATPase subunit type 1 TsaE n=1 Tax=Pseudanabaena sp. PCC 6802 TaxID=118173 RepID=UPI0003456D47|nr:tRNA (adenosine(37)-N6)-threonylcarbamoyltransferase complex ATPase subunit type 1 TsaE [Pseudanabaena sp. PCC 6802]